MQKLILSLSLSLSLSLLLFTMLFSKLAIGQTAVEFTGARNITDIADRYYSSPNYTMPDSLKGGLNKEYERTLRLWGPRLWPHGDFKIASDAMQDFAASVSQGTEDCDAQYSNIAWTQEGPENLPDGIATGIGRIHRVQFGPNWNGTSNQNLYGSSDHSGLWKSTNDGHKWFPLGTDLGIPLTSVSDFAINPNNEDVIFIATGLGDVPFTENISDNNFFPNPIWTIGIYRTTDGGANWEPINQGLTQLLSGNNAIRKLLLDPGNPNKLYAATSEGLFFTSDALSSNPTWVQNNSGISELSESRGIAIKPDDDQVLYYSSTDVYRSINGGSSWTTMTGAGTGFDLSALPENFVPLRINIAVTRANSELLYAYTVGNFISSDGSLKWRAYVHKYDGVAWTEIDQFTTSWAINQVSPSWMAIVISPIEENFVIYGHTHVRGRRNQGDSFSFFSPYNGAGFHADVHDLQFAPTSINPHILVGHHGGVSRGDVAQSVSGITSVNWNYRYGGLATSTIWCFDIKELGSAGTVIGTQDNGTSVIEKGMPKWSQIGGGDGYWNAIAHPFSPAIYHNPGLSRRILTPLGLSSQGLPSIPSQQHTCCNVMYPRSFPNTFSSVLNKSLFGLSEIYSVDLINQNGALQSQFTLEGDIGQVPIFYNNPGEGNQDWRHQLSILQISQINPDIVYAGVGGYFKGNDNDPYVKPALLKSSSGLKNGIYNPNETLFQDLTLNLPKIPGTNTCPVITGIATDPYNDQTVYISFSSYYEGLKVFKSSDGGINWISNDPNLSLPNLPVNDIVIQNGSQDQMGESRVFVATDAGVYVKEPGSECWERYGNIPNVRVTQLKLRECENSIWAATYGRGVWSAEMPLKSKSLSEVLINVDQIWDEDRFFANSLRITQGTTLTITAELHMIERGSIIIEPGATLIVDGGKITNACGQMWSGIQVMGETSAHQEPYSQGQYHQGRAIFRNGAVIENAREALTNWKWNNWSSRGGIIQANNTTFKNCKRVAAYYKYQNHSPINNNIQTHDRSFFRNCDFVLNDDYLEDMNQYPPFARVSMWGVNGVSFEGCRFVNQATGFNGSANMSKGIYSSDAFYRVSDYCVNPSLEAGAPCLSTPIVSSFKGFEVGIHAANGLDNNGPFITKTSFEENLRGIQLDNAAFTSVTFNEFKIGEHPFGPTFNDDATQHTGIYSNDNEFFTIEENEFEGAGNSGWDVHGVLIQNAGGEGNVLYKNTYSDLSAASIAAGENTAGPGARYYGLKFQCNDNGNNMVDFNLRPVLLGSGYSYVSTIQSGALGQGQYAGNTFSVPNGSSDVYTHFDFSSNTHYDYKYNPNNPFEVPSGAESHVTNGSISLIGDAQSGMPNQCLTNFATGISVDFSEKMIRYNDSKTAYYNLLYTYLQYIDQGNTEGLLNDIALSWPENAWELRNELMSIAPYVSDTVLMAVADQNILPHGMLLEVLTANPDALTDGRVIAHVACCLNNPLPSYMIDILRASNSIQTARTIAEQGLSNLATDMSSSYRHMVQYRQQDTAGVHTDTLRYWQSELRSLEGRYVDVFGRLSANDFSAANAALDSIDAVLNPKGNKRIEFLAVKGLASLYEQVYNDNRSIAELTDNEQAILTDLAHNSNAGTAASRANNIMCFFYNSCNQIDPVRSAKHGPKSMSKSLLSTLVNDYHILTASPNPGDAYVQIDFKMLNAKPETALMVWSIDGRNLGSYELGEVYEGYQVLDTRHFAPGMYIAEVIQNGERMKSVKFIVQH